MAKGRGKRVGARSRGKMTGACGKGSGAEGKGQSTSGKKETEAWRGGFDEV